MFNKIKEKDDKERDKEAKARIADCAPLALEILKKIGNANLRVGEAEDVKKDDVYNEMALEIIAMMLNNDVKLWDKEIVFQLAFQALEIVKDKVLHSIEMSYETARDKLFGKDILELRMTDVDEILKK